jgi:branched-chain amino acid transport system substrate-binding protein
MLFGLALVAAACGSDDETDAGAESSDSTEADSGGDSGDGDSGGDGSDGDSGGDDSGDGAMEAGEPIKIGVQNLEGDPNGSFPEYSIAIQAAADYVNAELDGLGGRPIEIVLCKSVVSPDDSQRCANELAADGVELVISTINFFGNHFAIYQGSEIPVIVGTPITIADFTGEGIYSIGAGGGCLGVHTGLIQFATQELPSITGNPVNKVGVPWADTPPGVVCYYDLEAKPLNVLNGTEDGASSLAGSMPDLTHIGVPIAPATPDVTPQATEVLDFGPDVIVFSAQGADCWNLVDGLGRLGWTPDETPLVLSGACTDFTAMAAAGDLAKGIYLTATENSVLSPLDGLSGQHLDNASTYQTKGLEYGMTEDDLFKGFAGQGFSTIMTIWELSQTIDGAVTGQSISDAFAATDGTAPAFGGSPLDCSGAPAPYVAVCSSPISITQWDGEKLVPVLDTLTGIDLVAGTELRPGP